MISTDMTQNLLYIFTCRRLCQTKQKFKKLGTMLPQGAKFAVKASQAAVTQSLTSLAKWFLQDTNCLQSDWALCVAAECCRWEGLRQERVTAVCTTWSFRHTNKNILSWYRTLLGTFSISAVFLFCFSKSTLKSNVKMCKKNPNQNLPNTPPKNNWENTKKKKTHNQNQLNKTNKKKIIIIEKKKATSTPDSHSTFETWGLAKRISSREMHKYTQAKFTPAFFFPLNRKQLNT